MYNLFVVVLQPPWGDVVNGGLLILPVTELLSVFLVLGITDL